MTETNLLGLLTENTDEDGKCVDFGRMSRELKTESFIYIHIYTHTHIKCI